MIMKKIFLFLASLLLSLYSSPIFGMLPENPLLEHEQGCWETSITNKKTNKTLDVIVEWCPVEKLDDNTIEKIIDIYNHTFNYSLKITTKDIVEEKTKGYLALLLKDKKNNVIGFAKFRLSTPDTYGAYLLNVCLIETCRGMGCGPLLIFKAIKKICPELKKITTLPLDTKTTYYEKLGFKIRPSKYPKKKQNIYPEYEYTFLN